jgi:hypothetical protein
MSTTAKIEVLVMLRDGTTVKDTFYKMIFQRIDEVLPAVVPGIPYTAEDLCGKEFWKHLANERTLAGKCVAHLVRSGKLPFVMVGCEHQYPRRYMLKVI